jgi:hypothetical protein
MLKIGIVLAIAALAVSSLSLVIGASPDYVAAQLCALMGLAAFVAISDRIPLIVSVMVIATLAKNFAISQVIKILMWQPADLGLAAPVMTAWVVAVGTLGCLAAPAAYIMVVKPGPSRAFLAQPLPPDMLGMIGWTFAVVGLACRAIALLPQASVVFFYLSALSYTAVAIFALENRAKTGKLWDVRTLLVLGASLALGLPNQSKTAILQPFALAGVLYISFRVAPRWLVTCGTVVSFVMVIYFLHPIINHARAHKISALDAVAELVNKPSDWDTIQTESDNIESHWTNRMYYGRPMGFITRFTPNQIADLVATQPYTDMKFGPYLSRSVQTILPQTFGFSRDSLLGQSQLESALQRKRVLGDNFANYGLFADLFLFGGFATLFGGAAAVVGLQMLLYTLVFGRETNALLSLSYGITVIFSLADGNLSVILINFVHGAVIIWGSTALLVLFLTQSSRASSTLPAPG